MLWKPVDCINEKLRDLQDSEYSIDYHATNKDNNEIVIQERFRRHSQNSYTDFTLRYERPENEEEIEQKSEFFKMKGKMKRFSEPFYMVYGIVNQETTDFLKFAVIDLRAFFKHYKKSEIVIDINLNNKKSVIKGNVLYAGINTNKDNSSTFVCFDILQLMMLFSDVIVLQEGFKTEKIGTATDKQIIFLKQLAIQNGFVLTNENILSKREASQLIELFKENIEIVRLFHNQMETGVFQNFSTYIKLK